jgi:predicted negative regulator of RcsB-dependent stress response
LRGELLLNKDPANAAEAERWFERAIENAQNQSGKSLELRAATSLARLLDQQGRRDEARTTLADIYKQLVHGGLRHR